MDQAQPTVVIDRGRTKHRWRRPSKRTIIIAAIALAVLLVGVITAILLTRGNDDMPASVPTVEITETGFSPAVIKVKKGEQIQWVNLDSRPHQIAADPHPTGESLPTLKSPDPLAEHESYTAVFENTGTFTYHDFLDPLGFQGVIIVE